MDILEKNLNLLKKKNAKLAEKIAAITELKSDFSLEEALSGDVNLRKNGIFIHDNVDPEQEAINLLREIKNNDSCSFNFIYGLGLGYVLKRFSKSLKGYIILFEPDIEILRLTFELVDFEEELLNENLFILDTLDDLPLLYQNYFFDAYEITTTISRYYREFDLDETNNFIKHLGYIHGLYLSNYDMYWNKTHLWIDSLLENLSDISKYDEVNSLKNIFKDKPALIVSAGPSLDKNIDLIAKYQDNFIIFAVGAALKSLVKHNIKPDFLCFIEYLPTTFKYIDGINLDDINLILQPITSKQIFNAKSKNKFLFYADNDEASKWLSSIFNIDNSTYINRGTVSVNALVSAKIMGCNPIALVGQDLAYTDNKCYSKDSLFGDYELVDNKVTVSNISEFAEKIANDESQAQDRMNSITKTLYKVKGQNGEDLLAPGDFASFIEYFEDIANIYKNDVNLINATEGGAQINGYKNMMLKTVVSDFANDKINKEFTIPVYNPEKHRKTINKEISILLNKYNNCYKNIFLKANKIANSINIEEKDKNPEKYMKELSLLLNSIKEIYLNLDSRLFALLLSKNRLFIDKYMKKTDDKTYSIRLLNHLICLFKDDYENFIKPSILKINNKYDIGAK